MVAPRTENPVKHEDANQPTRKKNRELSEFEESTNNKLVVIYQ